MSSPGSRRNFFERIRIGLTGLAISRALPFETAAAAQAPEATPSPTPPGAPVDYYDKLGVTKRINAAGTYTYLTGCLMPPSVQAAVAEAAKHPVFLEELQQAAGKYIAEKLKCESAMVTCGAASADRKSVV